MSRKPSRVAGSGSSEMIRRAVKNFFKMPKEKRIDLMVEAKVMTREQAERAKKEWARIQAAESPSTRD
jgi:hypothetical protein